MADDDPADKDYQERSKKLRTETREAFEISLKDAKIISDYTGMIMRFGFAILIASFFKSEADASTSWYWWGFMMYCAGLSLLLALALTNSIVNVTGFWLMTYLESEDHFWQVPLRLLLVIVTIGSVLAALAIIAWQFATKGSIP